MLDKQKAINLAIDEHDCKYAEELMDKVYGDDIKTSEIQNTVLRKLIDKLEEKTSWGRNDLKMVILDLLVEEV